MKELSLNILDIVQNSIRAGAVRISIRICESVIEDRMIICITDDGQGIPYEMLHKVTDPYVTGRSERKVGLGLPFLKQQAELAGGELRIRSSAGAGTKVEAEFRLNHIDRQPLGDITGVIKLLIYANPQIEFIYCHSTDNGDFCLSTEEVKQVLEVSNLSDYCLVQDIKGIMDENLKLIGVEA